MNFKLVSFVICPYVQRAIITLKFKNVLFDIEYIDLKNKPEWFIKLSPLGKVPILIIDNSKVIFESTVINELLDELNPPITLSADPIEKAHERAWIIFSDTLLSDLHQGLASEGTKYFDRLISKLEILENIISDKGYFKASGFSIVDSAYAPIFFRMQYIGQLSNHPQLRNLPKVYKWYNNLLKQDFIKDSINSDFEMTFKQYVLSRNPELEFIHNSCKIK
jgi:glutathione S-transferase